MPEWWTYRLSDFVMFAPRTYYRLFAFYNGEIWPAQIPALLAGIAVLGWMLRPAPARGRAIGAILAVAWLWVAWGYFHRRYATIHWAADPMAIGFGIEAALLAAWCVVGNGLRFPDRPSGGGWAGVALCGFGLLIQPWVGLLLGRPWIQVEVFGIAPDPTVLVTLGVLAAAQRPPWHLLPLPLLWCAYSGATLWVLGAPETLLLPAAALVTLAVTAWRRLWPGA